MIEKGYLISKYYGKGRVMTERAGRSEMFFRVVIINFIVDSLNLINY